MLEKIEGKIKNRQSRETDNIACIKLKTMLKRTSNTIYVGHHYTLSYSSLYAC
jgi:hypothetical protein